MCMQATRTIEWLHDAIVLEVQSTFLTEEVFFRASVVPVW